MNLILLFKKDFIDHSDKVCLKGRRHKHIVEIHRAKVKDKLIVGLENGRMGFGCITHLDGHVCEMDVVCDQSPPQALPLTLILALPRPIMLKRVLFSAASMGVKRIVLLHSSRVEKSFWNSHLLKDEKYKEQLVLGLEQARDTIMPEVIFKKKFKPFIEDELPDIIKGASAYIAHPEGKDSCLRNLKKPVVLAIGPEGGFIPYEIEKFISLGFKPFSLGPRVLRVETAVVALLSKMF